MDAAANVSGNSEQGSKAANLFPLDAKRSVVLRSGEKTYRHLFRRITAADYEIYCSKITLESADEDRGWSPLLNSLIVNSDEARIALYARAIERVEGYVTRDGREPDKLPNWPECIPLLHRLTAIELVFQALGTVERNTMRLEADRGIVSFVILTDESEPRMTQCYGVIHRFRAPAVQHRQQFLRVVNGSRSTLKILLSLYDELIESVEGYSVEGHALASREQIVREMDSIHKEIAAVTLLGEFFDCGGGQLLARVTIAAPGPSGKAN